MIILDCDIIEMAGKCEYSIRKLLFECTEWLFNNINYKIVNRREKLKKLCPGALFNEQEPNIMWIEAITRPTTSAKKEVFSLVYKFNAVMKECIQKFNDNILLTIDAATDLSCFDASGRLTPIGKERYWKELMAKLQELRKTHDNVKSKEDQNTINQVAPSPRQQTNNKNRQTTDNRSGDFHRTNHQQQHHHNTSYQVRHSNNWHRPSHVRTNFWHRTSNEQRNHTHNRQPRRHSSDKNPRTY